ncbi:IclR family transcriptional regulator [Rhodococcoides kyotonense]|uniref:IclR family transcriptional regulator, acetate operon repressor n=1 Tax=Rhodococcoides kyotonense TaxID=398843 RepID=A0A239NFZ9_9NOCA|nr:IclR family transcriptional regulator [Rhodococcus kyotonensis]SNT53334.1 IclR family transcriptional regulator, acetate operon repressor [Rhodococcus kyotonensis]
MRSVRIAFLALEAVAEQQPISVTDLATHLDLPKTTTHRVLTTLADLGWVRSDGGRYPLWSITAKAANVGSKVVREKDLRAVVLDEMRALAEATGETIHYSIPDRAHVVLIERTEGSNPVQTSATIGTRYPIHATAAGQAILATYSDAECRALVGGEELTPYTEFSITTATDLLAELARVRARGYSCVDRARHVDVSAVGAVVLDHTGVAVGALSISMPAHRVDEHVQLLRGEQVQAAAAAATKRLQQ